MYFNKLQLNRTVHVLNIMAEVGLVRIRHGNNSHWDCLKIMRANEIESF